MRKKPPPPPPPPPLQLGVRSLSQANKQMYKYYSYNNEGDEKVRKKVINLSCLVEETRLVTHYLEWLVLHQHSVCTLPLPGSYNFTFRITTAWKKIICVSFFFGLFLQPGEDHTGRQQGIWVWTVTTWTSKQWQKAGRSQLIDDLQLLSLLMTQEFDTSIPSSLHL